MARRGVLRRTREQSSCALMRAPVLGAAALRAAAAAGNRPPPCLQSPRPSGCPAPSSCAGAAAASPPTTWPAPTASTAPCPPPTPSRCTARAPPPRLCCPPSRAASLRRPAWPEQGFQCGPAAAHVPSLYLPAQVLRALRCRHSGRAARASTQWPGLTQWQRPAHPTSDAALNLSAQRHCT